MKAILVLDMPDTCEECPCCYGYICLHLGREMGLWALKMGKPVDCPLKPMPKRMLEVLQIRDEKIVNILETSFANGWNACLDEINATEKVINAKNVALKGETE